MSARFQLESYLDGARRRLQWILSARGAVLLLAGLLLGTLIAAWLLWQFAYGSGAAWTGRALLLAVIAGAVLWFAWRWRGLRGVAGARILDRALPGQEGRVATYLEESSKTGGATPLLGLLARDALQVAERESVTSAIPSRRIWMPALGAAAVLVLFAVLFISGGPVGEGARQLWAGRLPPAASVAAAAGGVAVQPGDTIMRRNQDLPISATVLGMAGNVQLHVRFENSDEWEIAPMDRDPDGSYAFTLYAVREGAEYYVTAGRLKSAEHKVQVVDLPTVDKLSLTYNFPDWTGLAQRVEEGGADIRAPSGTEVGLEVVTSAPLEGPLLVVDGNGKELAVSGLTSRGKLDVKSDGHYRIATRFLGEVVALTPDYLISVAPDEKPDVKFVKPAKDYRATAIEEVPVRVKARDDYRLEALELHYSVNGGDWRSEKLPSGATDIEHAALLRMEEMQQPGPNGEAPLLVPGDLVSYYAMAKDHSHEVQTDLFLIQIQPFEQRFTQSQAGGGGGGGGGGGEDDDISKRQKEVLLATWNLQRSQETATGREVERNVDNGRMLSQVQTTLAEQANTLVARARARALTGQDANVNLFVKSMEEAARAMDPAATNLAEMNLPEAVKYEQKALQLLLRAESAFRDIQVAMRQQQQGGGGGGGGSQAGRDVSEMTELELDLAKNQYETEQQVSEQQQGGGNAETEDELMRRLAELARRQEQLARDAARQQQLTEAQKWQQEQLRREAEQVREQLEQLAQQQNGSQQQRDQQGQQQGAQQNRQAQQQGQQGQQRGQQQGQQQGSQSGSRQAQQQGSRQQNAQQSAAQQAAQQVAQALEQMQSGSSQDQQRAAEQLNRAREQMERARQQSDAQRFSSLAEEARELAERQGESERELRSAIGTARQRAGSSASEQRNMGLSYEQMDDMAATRRELQQELEALQRRIDAARRENAEESPRATSQLAQARKDLQEQDYDAAMALARSASDVERGRIAEAASSDPVITDRLQRLQENLARAAETAAAESGARQRSRQADAGDLLAELGNLRRALDRAREQAMSQNQSGSGDPGANAPDAREGQQGQAGGQQGEQGQGGQGQRGQDGQRGNQQASQQPDQPGQQGGEPGNAPGGRGNLEIGGLGNLQGGGFRPSQDLRLAGGAVVPNGSQRELLRNQTQMSAERLAQLRAQLANGVLSAADRDLLAELEKRLKRGLVDPMSDEYRNMTDVVSQLELAALKAQQLEKGDSKSTHVDEVVDDSRQYRDNVAEYYRRLGGGND